MPTRTKTKQGTKKSTRTTVRKERARTTVDHDVIKEWVEDRDGHPARVKSTGVRGHGGLLRIDFGEPEANLERISWEEFLDAFEENELAFLYQEELKGGKTSRFFKFVNRDDALTDVNEEEEAKEEEKEENKDEDEEEEEESDDDDEDDGVDDNDLDSGETSE